MVIRIRLGTGPKLRRKQHKNRHVALAVAALISPAGVMALVLAFWRLAADLKFTGQFPITDGLFSHWQIWMAAGVALHSCAILLNRYGKPEYRFQENVERPNRQFADSRFWVRRQL